MATNWCDNSLTFYGPLDVLTEIADTKLSLRKLLPWPKALEGKEKVVPLPDKERAIRLELEKKYGVSTMQDWATSRWGTRGDPGPVTDLALTGPLGQDGHYELHAEFKSLWGPPVKALETLFDRYKSRGLEIWMEYHEPSCQFMGSVTTKSGEFTDEYRGYDTALELEKYCTELDHTLAKRDIPYLRMVEAEEKAAKQKKAPKSEKATKAEKAKPTPAKAEPTPVPTPKPPPPKSKPLSELDIWIKKSPRPAKAPETIFEAGTAETLEAAPEPKAAPASPKVSTEGKPATLPRLKIEMMMQPKSKRPPAPAKAKTPTKNAGKSDTDADKETHSMTHTAQIGQTSDMDAPNSEASAQSNGQWTVKATKKPAAKKEVLAPASAHTLVADTKKPASKKPAASKKVAAKKPVKAAAKPVAKKAVKPAAKKPAAPKKEAAKKSQKPAANKAVKATAKPATKKAATPAKKSEAKKSAAPAKKASAPKKPVAPAKKAPAKSSKAPAKK